MGSYVAMSIACFPLTVVNLTKDGSPFLKALVFFLCLHISVGGRDRSKKLVKDMKPSLSAVS